VAGVAFGIMFVGLAQAGRGSGLWPVASEQTSSLLVMLAVAVKAHAPLRAPARTSGQALLVGLGGMTATLLFFYATHAAMLATVAVIVSLYPGVTVLLARVILHERFSLAQRAGLGMCTLAVIAIALN
jgi:drug/metabolite transporter (DMT)-like permease